MSNLDSMFDGEFVQKEQAADGEQPRDEKGRFAKGDDEAPKFVREIDLGDGSGVQRFEGESAEELIDKLTKAQENATRKIKQLTREAKRAKLAPPSMQPVKREEPRQPRRLNDDEAFMLVQKFQTNPLEAFETLSEVTFGYKPSEITERLTKAEQLERDIAESQAAMTFMQEYSDEYIPTPSNYEALKNFLDAHRLPMTAQNLASAFESLSSSGLLEVENASTRSEEEEQKEKEQQSRIEKEVATKKKAVSGLPDRSARRTEGNTETLTDEELRSLSLEEARNRLVTALHAAKRGTSR